MRAGAKSGVTGRMRTAATDGGTCSGRESSGVSVATMFFNCVVNWGFPTVQTGEAVSAERQGRLGIMRTSLSEAGHFPSGES